MTITQRIQHLHHERLQHNTPDQLEEHINALKDAGHDEEAKALEALITA